MYKYAISFPDPFFEDQLFRETIATSRLKRVEYSCNDSVKGQKAYSHGKLAAELQAEGLIDIASVHIPFGGGWSFASPDESLRREAVDNTLEFLDAFAPTKTKNYTMHTCLEPVSDEERPQAMKAIAKTIEELLPTAARMGVSINMENLPRTCLGNTPDELLEIIRDFPTDNLGVCFDVNHFCNCANVIPQAIDLLGKHIRAFHISDYDGVDECHWFPGFGRVNWSAVMERIRSLPNNLTVIFECFGFLTVPQRQAQSRKIYDCIINGMLRNAFYLENADEITSRIQNMTIN